jgi:phage terminase large subunit GpA-like protein
MKKMRNDSDYITPYKSPEQIVKELNKAIKPALEYYKPPEKLTLDEWSDKYRRLSPESSAEAGPWRTERTPYLREPMRAFTDPKVKNIVMVASSQVGKSEFELNAIGYIIDQAPGSVMYVQPNLDAARKFSRLRIAPMIRDSKTLKSKVHNVKSRSSGNTILQKSFPGGMLTITGSESPSALASTPARYIIGDERDRWAKSAGTEGDPWELLKARQATFYNAKSIEVSTPTIKGASAIETSFLLGTQERWCHQCPECGEFTNIVWDTIRFNPKVKVVNNKKFYDVTDIGFACPHCGCVSTEDVMRRQPAKWIAENPEAYDNGVRSFWLNAFSSPWTPWKKVIMSFLEAKDDPEKLQVVFNTMLGELWEDRGDLMDEDEMMARREEYEAELPEGVLALTCGVDTQDNRLEYEIIGHGFFKETWGIYNGYILGRPDSPEVWRQLDEVIDRYYYFKNGKHLKIGLTFIDSGGHFTQEVYEQCRIRQAKRVFAIKGKGGENVPYISTKPSQVVINGNSNKKAWLYIIGVDAGKTAIMSNLKVETPGASFCHFPRGEERGYDSYYFNGLLSEKLVLNKTKTGNRWVWEKIPGHQRNEALDCRNYANAAFRVWNPDLNRIFQKLKEPIVKPAAPLITPKKKKTNNVFSADW